MTYSISASTGIVRGIQNIDIRKRDHHFLILGGGISGLSALHFLNRLDPMASTRLYEASPRVGGLVHTKKVEIRLPGGDLPFEYRYEIGPRSLQRGSVSSAIAPLGMIFDLSLTDYAVLGHPDLPVGMYLDGKVRWQPKGKLKWLRNPWTWKYGLSLAKALYKRPTLPKNDVTIGDFARSLGGNLVADHLAAAMTVGVSGGNINRLSLKSTFPLLVERLKALLKDRKKTETEIFNEEFEKTASDSSVDRIIKEQIELSDRVRKQFPEIDDTAISRKEYEFLNVYFKFTEEEQRDILVNAKLVADRGLNIATGLDTLTERMAEWNGYKIQTDTPIVKIAKRRGSNLLYIFRDEFGEPFDCGDVLISALPSYILADLIDSESPKASKLLREIEFVDMAMITLLYDGKIIPKKHLGVGYLVPPIEKRPVIGVSFDSVCFPSEVNNRHLTTITVMMGGDLSNGGPDVSKMSKEEMKQIAIQTLKEDVNIDQVPIYTDVNVIINAIPQYTVGHASRVEAIRSQLERDLPNLTVTGASYDGAGVWSCIKNGMVDAGHAKAKFYSDAGIEPLVAPSDLLSSLR